SPDRSRKCRLPGRQRLHPAPARVRRLHPRNRDERHAGLRRARRTAQRRDRGSDLSIGTRRRISTAMKKLACALVCMMAAAALHAVAMQKAAPGGYIVAHDAEVSVTEPGTDQGGGQTVRYAS